MSTVFIIDFQSKPSAAFKRGFLKGLAAPVVLFSTNAAPGLPSVALISPPSRPHGTAGALASSWVKVGAGLQAAIEQHVKEPAQPTADAQAG